MMDESIDLKCDCGVREAPIAVCGKYFREGWRLWRVRQRVDVHSAFEHLHHLAHPWPSRRFLLQAPYRNTRKPLHALQVSIFASASLSPPTNSSTLPLLIKLSTQALMVALSPWSLRCSPAAAFLQHIISSNMTPKLYTSTLLSTLPPPSNHSGAT